MPLLAQRFSFGGQNLTLGGLDVMHGLGFGGDEDTWHHLMRKNALNWWRGP
jgi:hypothetical protein